MRISDWSSDVCSSDLAGVGLVIDAIDEHRRVVLRRRRQDHLLRARIEMLLRAGLVEEQTGRLDDYVGTDFVPFQIGGIAFLRQADLLAIDQQRATFTGDLALSIALTCENGRGSGRE